MPQYLTLNISAKVDKGPDIKSEAKFEISNYAPLIDEQICRCTSTQPPFDLPAFKSEGLQVLITADKYYTEKDCVPTPTSTRLCEPKKFISYQLTKDGAISNNPLDWKPLQRPLILAADALPEFNGIAFKNDLTIDVKVSVLVFRMTPESCPSVVQQNGQQQNGQQQNGQQMGQPPHQGIRYQDQGQGREGHEVLPAPRR